MKLVNGASSFGPCRNSHAKDRSNGKFPCAPLMIEPSGMTRVWHMPHELTPISTLPFSRMT